MTSEDSSRFSSQELGEQFDVRAVDAKEHVVFLVGLERLLLCWNSGAERLFDDQSNEIIGRHFSHFFACEDVVTAQPEHELTQALPDG